MPPIMTGYGFQSTAADVAEGADLSGRHAVVTGGTSPIGMETARELARAGAAVTLAVNDLAAGQHAAVGITAATGNPDVDAARLNLADPKSVEAFAEAWDRPLHLLINNAGITSPARPHTIEGMEPHFAVNHLGHFALARALHRALAAANGARIVVVSSSAHLFSPVVFDDIHFTFRPTTRSWPTRSPEPRTCSSPSAQAPAGPTTASPPTPSARERSAPADRATGPANLPSRPGCARRHSKQPRLPYC